MKKYERDLHAKEKESERTRAGEPSCNHEMHKILSDLKDFIIGSHSLHMDMVEGNDRIRLLSRSLPPLPARYGRSARPRVPFLRFLYLTRLELLRALSKHGSRH